MPIGIRDLLPNQRDRSLQEQTAFGAYSCTLVIVSDSSMDVRLIDILCTPNNGNPAAKEDLAKEFAARALAA